jgi:hypothetical protein
MLKKSIAQIPNAIQIESRFGIMERIGQVKDLMPWLMRAAGSAQAQYGAVSLQEPPSPPGNAAVQKNFDELGVLETKIKALQRTRMALGQYVSADETRKVQREMTALKEEIEASMRGARKNLDAVLHCEDYPTRTMYGVLSRRLNIADQAYREEIAKIVHERQRVQEMLDDVPAPGPEMMPVETYEETLARERAEKVRRRDEQVSELANSMEVLAEVTQDLAKIVEQQRPVLDRIEVNVARAEDYTADAATELRQAHHHQSSARKTKMCVCALLLVILVIMVLLITLVKPSKH